MNGTNKNKLYGAYDLLVISVATVITIALMLFSLGFLSQASQAAQYSESEGISAVQSLSGTGIITETNLLAIYALAFDNDPSDPLSLSLYYTSTINSIAQATLNAPNKTAVILADLDNLLDTHILIAQNGQLIPIDGLPKENPVGTVPIIDTSLNEYNMSDGEQLGHFLQWTRQVFSADAVTFSFLGHGAPLVPELAPEMVQIPAATATVPWPPTPDGGFDNDPYTPQPTPFPTPTPEPVPPLPSGAFVHSGFTDFHSASLISIHALAKALKMGSNNGADPFQTVDLVQCFASSIEELYELHPYAETFTGSPNYAYSKPEMIGTALNAISSSMSATQIADTLIQTYDNELPAADHPRLLVAVESSKVNAIKESWDMTSYHLSQQFEQDQEITRNKITDAYRDSAKYDTTLCNEPDFLLAVPDSVSDMSDFASQLSTLFGPTSPTGSWAITTTARIDDAIISRYARNGVPWFAVDAQAATDQIGDQNVTDSTVPEWVFDGAGISLYTDFGPAVSGENPVELDWFSAWYTDTADLYNDQLYYKNELPYSFLTGGSAGVSWADVFSQFWTDATRFENVRCKPAFLAGRGIGEMTVLSFTPSTATSALALTPNSTHRLHPLSEGGSGEFVRFFAEINTSIEAVNPQVHFNVYDNNDEPIYAEGVSGGYLEVGETKVIQSAFRWPIPEPGIYFVEIHLDPDERFIESNEEDNVVRFQVTFESNVFTTRLPIIYQ